MERILNEVHTVSQLPARHMRDKLVNDFDRELEDWQKNIGPRCSYPRPDDMHPTRTRYLTHAVSQILFVKGGGGRKRAACMGVVDERGDERGGRGFGPE